MNNLPEYKTFPGTINGDAQDSFYTGGFLAKWKQDAVAAIVYHQMGDRDSYEGQYIWRYCEYNILLWAEVDQACLNFFEAWATLPDAERNHKDWWAALETVVSLAKLKDCPQTNNWMKQNKELLIQFPHLAPHCQVGFIRTVRTMIGELDWQGNEING